MECETKKEAEVLLGEIPFLKYHPEVSVEPVGHSKWKLAPSMNLKYQGPPAKICTFTWSGQPQGRHCKLLIIYGGMGLFGGRLVCLFGGRLVCLFGGRLAGLFGGRLVCVLAHGGGVALHIKYNILVKLIDWSDKY